MLSESHPLSRYKTNSGKNKKEMFDAFLTLVLGSFPLAIDTRYNFATDFLQ